MNSKEQIIENLKDWLKNTNVILYSDNIPFRCSDKELCELRNGKKKEIYIVTFHTKDYIKYNKNGEIIMLIEGKMCFAHFDAETFELLYIITNTGYIEPDGSY